MCKVYECNKAHLRVMKEDTSITPVNIDLVKARKQYDNHIHNMIKNCRFCGYDHEKMLCPAYGKKCTIFAKWIHFKEKGRQKKNFFVTYQFELPFFRVCQQHLLFFYQDNRKGPAIYRAIYRL
uniref:Uncharacterized protein n=1 Tax=Cacopsylla melanoneura TaxID=428564 RepID=A0A8D9EWF8_9HEMI